MGTAAHETANPRAITFQPQRAVLEPARCGLGRVRRDAVTRRAGVREALGLRPDVRGRGDRRLRAVGTDALDLPAAVEPPASRAGPGRARDLLRHRARAAR